MTYILENKNEGERLTYQSSFPAYDYKKEFNNFIPLKNEHILDAGCGSGILTHHFSKMYPDSNFEGIDFSEERVASCNNSKLRNSNFQTAALTSIPFKENYFNHILNRYVIEHIPLKDLEAVLSEFYRVLKPNGILHLVDFDSPIVNIYPQTKVMTEFITLLQASKELTIDAARRMPILLHKTGFQNISWDIEVINCSGELLQDEIKLFPERLSNIKPFIAKLLGSEFQASQFIKQYLETLEQEGTTLFYNKFIISAIK